MSQPMASRLSPLELGEAFFFAKDLFRTPSAAQWAWLNSRDVSDVWGELQAALHFTGGAMVSSIGLPPSAAQYESEYIEAFEVGAPHAPVPLIESHYNKRDPVPKVLHENVLFYQAFGLRLRAMANETADHLRHQLEFVGYLCRLEAERLDAPQDDAARKQIRRARADYTARHLLSWLPKASEAAAKAPYPWVRRYLALALALARVAE